MNISLLNPPWYDENDPTQWGVRAGSRWPHLQTRPAAGKLPRYIPFPFSLAIAASVLQNAGHTVQLLDAVAEDITVREFIRRVSSFHPDVVFFETSTPSLHADMKTLHLLRGELPKAFFIGSGTHTPALVPELFTEFPALNAWLSGEYEYTLAALVDARSLGKSVDGIPGLILPGKKVILPTASLDVNTLPRPLYEQLPMMHYHDPVCGLPAPSAQTWLSRGCPFGCTFCVWPQVIYNSRRYRPRNIQPALDEVEHLITTCGCESFYFDDDTANLGESRMLDLAAAIAERGLNRYPWAMMARADCMTPRMLDALAAAGMYSVKYGVESIAPSLINACEKDTNLPRLCNAIEQTRAAGIKMHLTFTFGIPGETIDTIHETLDFCLRIAPETAQFSFCTPFPGTRFYEVCKANDWLTTSRWEDFLGGSHTVINTPWLSAAQLETEYHHAVNTWTAFTNRRLEERQKRLAQRMAALPPGTTWLFAGERDFAQPLLDAMPTPLKEQEVDTPQENTALIIISRYDEEKLFRRWTRDHGFPPDKILRVHA